MLREPGEERLVDEGAVRLVLVAGGVDLLAGRDVHVRVAVEEPLDVLEEDRVAVEVERLRAPAAASSRKFRKRCSSG